MTSVKTEQAEILEPLGDVEDARQYRLAARAGDLNGKIIGLLSNRVSNADLFMEKIKRLLTERFHAAQVIIGSSEAELAEKCDAFITGIGH